MTAPIVVQVAGRRISFPLADHPLTDDEIEEQHGDPMAEGVAAMRADPEIVVLMAEAGARLRDRLARERISREALLERNEKITVLAEEGLSGAAIARALGLHPSTVYGRLKRMGEVEGEADTPGRDPVCAPSSRDRQAC